jgi:hypothetical protein
MLIGVQWEVVRMPKVKRRERVYEFIFHLEDIFKAGVNNPGVKFGYLTTGVLGVLSGGLGYLGNSPDTDFLSLTSAIGSATILITTLCNQYKVGKRELKKYQH